MNPTESTEKGPNPWRTGTFVAITYALLQFIMVMAYEKHTKEKIESLKSDISDMAEVLKMSKEGYTEMWEDSDEETRKQLESVYEIVQSSDLNKTLDELPTPTP